MRIRNEEQFNLAARVQNKILEEFPQLKTKKDVVDINQFFIKIWVAEDSKTGKAPTDIFNELYSKKTHQTCNAGLVEIIDKDNFRLEIIVELFEKQCNTRESNKVARKGLVFCGSRYDCYGTKYERDGLQRCKEHKVSEITKDNKYNFLIDFIIEDAKEIATFKNDNNEPFIDELSWKDEIIKYVEGKKDKNECPTEDNEAQKHEEAHVKKYSDDIIKNIKFSDEGKYLGMKVQYILKNCGDQRTVKIFEFERDFRECYKSCPHKSSNLCKKDDYQSQHMDEVLHEMVRNIIIHKYIN